MKTLKNVIYGTACVALIIDALVYFSIVLYDGLSEVHELSTSGWGLFSIMMCIAIVISRPVKQYITGVIREVKRDMRNKKVDREIKKVKKECKKA